MSLAVSAMFNVSFKNDLDKRALICPSVRVTKNPCREALEVAVNPIFHISVYAV